MDFGIHCSSVTGKLAFVKRLFWKLGVVLEVVLISWCFSFHLWRGGCCRELKIGVKIWTCCSLICLNFMVLRVLHFIVLRKKANLP